MELRHRVEQFAVVFERDEAVSRAGRYVERQAIRRTQLDGFPFPIRLRIRANVEDDVVNRSAYAAHELRLFMRRDLVMHSAQRPLLRIVREAALCNRRSE